MYSRRFLQIYEQSKKIKRVSRSERRRRHALVGMNMTCLEETWKVVVAVLLSLWCMCFCRLRWIILLMLIVVPFLILHSNRLRKRNITTNNITTKTNSNVCLYSHFYIIEMTFFTFFNPSRVHAQAYTEVFAIMFLEAHTLLLLFLLNIASQQHQLFLKKKMNRKKVYTDNIFCVMENLSFLYSCILCISLM